MATTSIKSLIGEVRFSYLHVFAPWKDKNDTSDKEPSYTATLLIPKSNTALVKKVREDIRKAYDAAVTERWGGKKPADGYWHDPLQDGDAPKQDGELRDDSYHGCWFINTKCRKQPVVLDRHKEPIIDSRDFYSGCYGYASVGFSGFIFGKKMGISCFLNSLLMSREGDPLGASSSNAEADFASLNLDDDEEM